MHNLKAAANDPAALEQAIDLFWCGIGSHVEILGLAAAKDVTQAAADKECFKACFM